MQGFRYQYGDRPLEGYTIQRAAGRGGFGEVYYALSDAGKEVALKVVQVGVPIELRGVAQCMNLKSAHLVSTYDVRTAADGSAWVIMEFVHGPNLADIIDATPGGLGVAKTAFFLREIAKGLTALHDQGIVHRDLKPGNIFYEDGVVKIGDYGLSKAISASVHSGQTVTVGTVHYMAPEIGQGRYDRSVDIYALGALTFEMLTGRPPFSGSSPGEILLKHLQQSVDVSGLPQPFADAVSKAMSKDPLARFASVREMVEAVLGAEHVRDAVTLVSPASLSMHAERAVAGAAPMRHLWAGGSSAQAGVIAAAKAGEPQQTDPRLAAAAARMASLRQQLSETQAKLTDVARRLAADPTSSALRRELRETDRAMRRLARKLRTAEQQAAKLADGSPRKRHGWFDSDEAEVDADDEEEEEDDEQEEQDEEEEAQELAKGASSWKDPLGVASRLILALLVSLFSALALAFLMRDVDLHFALRATGAWLLVAGAAGGCFGAYQLIVRRILDHAEDVTTRVVYVAVAGTIGALPMFALWTAASLDLWLVAIAVVAATLVPMLIMDMTWQTSPGRPVRLSLGRAAVTGLIGGIVGMILLRHELDGSFWVIAGFPVAMSLVLQLLSGWDPRTPVLVRQQRVAQGATGGHAATPAGHAVPVIADAPPVDPARAVGPARSPLPPAPIPARTNTAEAPATRHRGSDDRNAVSPLSRGTALLLSGLIFVGVAGVHRFYAGKIGTGLLYLFTGGLLLIGQIVDIARLLSGQFRDDKRRRLTNWELTS